MSPFLVHGVTSGYSGVLCSGKRHPALIIIAALGSQLGDDFFFHPLSAYITSELTVLRGRRMVFHQASCLLLFVSQRWQNSFVINEQHPHQMEGANQFLFYICSISGLVQPTDA